MHLWAELFRSSNSACFGRRKSNGWLRFTKNELNDAKDGNVTLPSRKFGKLFVQPCQIIPLLQSVCNFIACWRQMALTMQVQSERVVQILFLHLLFGLNAIRGIRMAIGSLVGGLKIVVNENFIFDFSIVDFFRKEVKIARKVNRFSRALLNVKSSKKAPLKPKIFTEIWFGKKPVGLVLYALISQHRTIPLFFFLPEKAFVAPDVISIIFFKIRVKYWFLRKNS